MKRDTSKGHLGPRRGLLAWATGAAAMLALALGLGATGHADMVAEPPPMPAVELFKAPVGDSPIRGKTLAKVTIVVFSDFECPFCARVTPTMDRVLKEYPDARLVWKNNPLPFHKNARSAALAGVLVSRYGDFWKYHDILYRDGTPRKPLSTEIIRDIALDCGVPSKIYDREIESPSVAKAVDADIGLAARLGLRGTPSFLINGRKLTGARPFESFAEVIDEEIERADGLLARGVPRKRLYERLIADGLEEAAKSTTSPATPATKMPWDAGAELFTIPLGTSPVGGPSKAPVTIVEFTDFQCPYCSRLQETLIAVHGRYKGKVRFVFKHFPLAFHADAPLAHEAAAAAHAQGQFWLYHDLLFAAEKHRLKRDDLERYGEEVGLDMKRFRRDLDSHRYKADVDDDIALGKKLGVTGTPTVFINGKKMVGARPVTDFERAIDFELGR